MSVEFVYVVFQEDPANGYTSAEPWVAYLSMEEAEAFCARAYIDPGNVRKVGINLPDSTWLNSFVVVNREGEVIQSDMSYVEDSYDSFFFIGSFQYRRKEKNYGQWMELRLGVHVSGSDLNSAVSRAQEYREVLIQADLWPEQAVISTAMYDQIMPTARNILGDLAARSSAVRVGGFNEGS